MYERPGGRAFLARVLELFTVEVWTSSGEGYASIAVRHLVERERVAFVHARDRRVRRRYLETDEIV